MSSSASAVTLTIEDTYIGGGYQNTYAHNNGDVIAGNSGNHVRQERYINEFNIDGMTVEIDGQGNIKVIIQTDYCPNIAGTGTDYGDLFISTDGWNQDMNSTESCNLAFRWTMTCANDIIEGGVNWQSIPEPGTMALLGVGLLILGTMGRRFLESFNAEVKTSRGASSQYLLAGA